MTAIEDILNTTKHRPFDCPTHSWTYYQEWNNALFLHWQVPFESLRSVVPHKLNLDSFEGAVYVSIVAFTMQKIRRKNFPSVKYISDFDEINVRTYIDNDNRKGVYFLNIEAGNHLSAIISKTLSGLPYEKSNIKRTTKTYTSHNVQKDFHLDTEFETKKSQAEKSALDNWLTERYCLYLDKGTLIYRYDIHHKEWEINDVEITRLDVNYRIGKISLTGKPDLIHYSDGVKVIAWEKVKTL